MTACDFHLHTTFSDGKNTPEEMVLAAIRRGFDTVGFSDHSYTAFDESWCMPKNRISDYRAEIARLREKYAGQINILCGIEQDFFSDEPLAGYDYAIGSVHYVKAKERYFPVDGNAAATAKAVQCGFGGDPLSLAEAYFASVAEFADDPAIAIVGHFDLITKFCEQAPIFDEDDPRYKKAWQSAADRLIAAGKCFEINTGAISRGYRTSPYPSERIISYLIEKNARLILSSDSHSRDNIGFGFDAVESKYGNKLRISTPDIVSQISVVPSKTSLVSPESTIPSSR